MRSELHNLKAHVAGTSGRSQAYSSTHQESDGGGGGTTSGCWSCWVAVGVGVGRQRGKKYPTDLDKQIEVLIVCSVCGEVFCFVCVEKLNQY